MTDETIEITAREILGDLANVSRVETLARDFAIEAHGEQRYGEHPYVTHLAAVRDVLIEFGCAEQTFLICAWLHDTIEDTTVTREQLDAKFGTVVAWYVYAVTGIGKNRDERNRVAYTKMKLCPESILLKLADRIANMRSAKATRPDLFAMYAREYTTFSRELRPATQMAEVVCAEAMWRELDRME